MDNKSATTWASEVYKGNYQDYWTTDFCLWIQFALRDYALADFPNGESIMGCFKWHKDNGTDYKP